MFVVTAALGLFYTAAAVPTASAGPPPVCSAQSGRGCFIEVASPTGAWMGDVTGVSAFSFTPNADVRFEIYDTAGGPLVAGPFSVRSDGMGRAAYFGFPAIKVGNNVVVTDLASGVVKQLEVLSLTVDTVDIDADKVAGTAPAGAMVSVNVTQPDGSVPNATITATQSGTWTADFRAQNVNLTGSTSVGAWIFDSDGDKTLTSPRPGCPATRLGWFWDCSIHSSLERDGMQVNWATPNSDVRLQVFDAGGRSIWGPVEQKTDAQGDLGMQLLGFDSDIDLVSGDRMVMTDLATSTVKTLQLMPLSIDSVDPATDVVAGSAPAGTSLDVWAETSRALGPTSPITVQANGSGIWTVDFRATIGHDITDTDAVSAASFDADGDVTMDALGAPLGDCVPDEETVCGTAGPDTIRPTGSTTSSQMTDAATAVRTRAVYGGPGDDILLATVKKSLRRLKLDVGSGAVDRVVIRPGAKGRAGGSIQHVVVRGRTSSLVVVLPAHAGRLVVKVTGANGSDRVSTRTMGGKGASPGGYLISGKAGADKVITGDGADRLLGGPGNDVLTGGRGKDVLKGGPGADTLKGGPGRDTCFKGRGDNVKSCEIVRRGK